MLAEPAHRALGRVAVLFTISAFACGDGPPLEHRADTPPPVPVVVPSNLAGVAAAIGRFSQALAVPFASFRLHRQGDPLFPEESQLGLWAAKNPDLKTYLDEPVEARVDDLYLAAPEDLYWSSEYFRGGAPVAFRTNFLIHFAPRPNGTAVSVYEFLPQVRLGKRWGMTRHGPGFYYFDEWVAPTNKDKSELLKAIVALF